MATHPLSHHEILRLVEPFARRGRRVDLAASQRMERRLLFQPVPLAGDLQETLQLENPDPAFPGDWTLTRRIARPGGLQARLQADGDDPATLLERVSAPDAQAQFVDGEGWQMALGHRVRASGLQLTQATVQLPGLRLEVRVPVTPGYPADIELQAEPGTPLALPEDLLAVLGREWGLLRPVATAAGQPTERWRAPLALRGSGTARCRDAQAKLARTATHLAQTLALPPSQFAERQRAARWRVVGRRLLPLAVCAVLLVAAGFVGHLDLAQNSVVRMLIFHAPPLMLVTLFCMQELPRFEIPPLPRALDAAAWPVRAQETP